MILRPRLRKFALTAHVVSSVGWLGAIGVFLALSVLGLTGQDAPKVRGAYLAMEAIGWFVLVPLSLVSLLTGLVQGLGTKWGLLRHYWVVVKLVINLVATVVLLLTGGGNHGPGRHTGSADTPPANVQDAGGHQPPAGGHTR